MDTEKLERLRERLLQCSVCMEEFKDPRILPCHHTLCFECISSVVQSSITGRCFRCPQCRSDIVVPSGGIEELPINFYIISLQDELGTRDYTGTCNICERDWLVSQFRCIDCDLDICRFCIHSHRLTTHTESPKILRIETTASNDQLASNRPCPEHSDEILQVFCLTCNEAICLTCSCTSHKQHSVVPINIKLQDSKVFLQSELDRLTSEKRKVLKSIESLEKVKKDMVAISKIALLLLDNSARRVCEMIMKKKSEIENEILGSDKKQSNDIQKVKDNLKSYVQHIDRGLAFLLDLQDNDICLEVVDSYKEFSQRLDAAGKTCIQNQLAIKEPHFIGSRCSRFSEVNSGLERKLYFHGNLGSLSRKDFCLFIEPKTFGIQKVPRGMTHFYDSFLFQKFVQFLLIVLLLELFLYVGHVSGTFDHVIVFISGILK